MLSFIIISIALAVAGFMRGYTGFGFAAIMILVLSNFYPVAEMVPAVLFIDLLISVPLVVKSWKATNFHSLKPIILSTLLGIPFGLVALNVLSDPVLKVLVSTTILTLAILPALDLKQIKKWIKSPWLSGFMSGWVTSAVSAGGVLVVIYYRYTDLAIREQRNTLITYFFLVACLVVGVGSIYNQRVHVIPEYPLFFIALAFAFTVLGKKAFEWKESPRIHQGSYYLIVSLSCVSFIKAVAGVV